jgi:glycosyltransferase involved in cell wall biosynthesis
MNIGIDVTPVLPGGACGGVKQLIIELLRGFAKKNSSDRFILLTAYFNEDIFKEFEQYGIQQICILTQNSREQTEQQNCSMLNQRFYDTVLKENDINVLFCPMTDPIHHEPGIPTVSLICDLQHLYYPLFFDVQELVHRNNLYERLKTSADYIICISSYTKKTVHEQLHIPNERVFVIPISVHARLDNPGTAKAGRILTGYNLDDKKYCIYPANLWPHKNHKMLLLSYSRFVKLYPQYRLDLVLTGAAVDHNNVMQYSRRIGLTEQVHFLGYLSEEELAAVWDGAHFLIFPSLFEGFGIPLVEAMMYGKPILASKVTSIPEVAGGAALYFDPRKPDEIVEALRQIMSDEGLYRRLVEEGKKQLERYRYEEMVAQYLEVLHRAVEGGSVAEYAEVTGIYHDCWAGEQIEVGLGAGKGRRMFTLRGYIPEWHPAREVKLKVTLPDGRKKSYLVHKDEELTMKEYLPEQAGVMKIAVSGGFRPDNGDIRTLTFLVDEASVINTHGGMKLYEFSGQRI